MKKSVYFVFGILIVLSLLFVIRSGPSITSASVLGNTNCVGAKEAINLINEKNCERVYQDEECAEKGLVEVMCP